MLKQQQSVRMFEEMAQVIPGGVNTNARRLDPPLVFERAEGATITDVDGITYIDYHCAFGPIILGHCHPQVAERVFETMKQIDLIGVGTMDLEGQLARKVVHHVPSAEQVLFCTSGSEATFHAVRLARAVTGRKRIVKFQGCYHGWHDYLATNVSSAPNRLGSLDPLSAGSLVEALSETIVLPFNDVETLERTIGQQGEQIAAVILEPVSHAMGCVIADLEFLQMLRRLTEQRGIILVFDEVVTGFRHALGGYQSICGITPDLTTLGKAISNGFPLAALVGRRRLMQRFNTVPGGDVYFGGTYNAHPWALSAGVATVEILEDPEVYSRMFDKGEHIRRVLTEQISKLGLPAQVVGLRSVWQVNFFEGPNRTYTDLLRNNKAMDLSFRRGLVSRGIFAFPAPLKNNRLTASHTDEQVAKTLQVTEDVLGLLAAGKPTTYNSR